MGWSLPPLLVLVLVAGMVAPPLAGAIAQPGGSPQASAPPLAATSTTPSPGNTTSTSTPTPTPTATGGDMAPGARLAGEIGVRDAELEGDVESRAFEIRVERADSPEARAQIVSDRVAESREKLETLERRRSTIRAALENGSMTRDEYRARRAMIAARAQTQLSILVRAEEIVDGLPTLILADVGIDLTTIRSLQSRARALSEFEGGFAG